MRTFLTAEWRSLAILNFDIDPELLVPLVPHGTELDTHGGRSIVSLVGFIFANTRVLGFPIPGHRTFEEVNLRFYVRRMVDGETRRAVTFIKELVPRPLVAHVARFAYNEPYDSLPMRHAFERIDEEGVPQTVSYEWRAGSGWGGLRLERTGEGRIAPAGSEEEFVTEHYWGYTRQRDGSTVEYHVDHPRWRIWHAASAQIVGDVSAIYGRVFGRVLKQSPTSALFADGSPVTVGWPVRLS